MEYSAIKRNEVLIHTTTRMNLENNMLNEISQTQKVPYDSIYMKCTKIHKSRGRKISGCLDLEGMKGLREVTAKRDRVSLGNSENVLKLIVVKFANSANKLPAIKSHTLDG